MLKHSIKTLTVGGALVLATAGAWAQTTTPTTPVPETKIGVSPRDAKEATQKAVPNSQTGTLVRTAPSAAERASDMTKDAKEAVNGDKADKAYMADKADKRATTTPKQPTPGPTNTDPAKPVINPAPTAKP